ncbi:uncharacterized protein LOC132888716 isoform X2 [Neoarius graeffei]|uniref:uncharacterized protein LOC132888716 isoform X2 n=1 Tax=Neoarius graeffei TaxID=443677 RepID=UPI00298C948E|nr:uncharacterized protein LOC132888716 isoform X2 [Neoarius graeffei]
MVVMKNCGPLYHASCPSLIYCIGPNINPFLFLTVNVAVQGMSVSCSKLAMSSPAILKIVLADNTCQRLTFPSGLPGAIEDLVCEVKRQCGLTSNFRLQFMDPLFGNDFMNLTSMNEVQDRGTIRIVPDTFMCMNTTRPISTAAPSTISDFEGPSSPSLSSADTDVISSPDSEPSRSRSLWPSTFHCPMFSYDAELKLQKANAVYRETRTLLCADADPKLKSDILHGLTQEIVKYGVSATDRQFSMVGKALISKHPCLAEENSFTGYAGWKISLKNKLAMYHSRLRKLGCPEVMINSVQRTPGVKTSPALGIKKPKRSEVNYCPAYPTGENDMSLEKLRVELTYDVQTKNSREIKMKMEKTFAYRRKEVVCNAPMIHEVQQRWPALFDVHELDILSDKLVKLFKKRAGQIGTHLKRVLSSITQDGDGYADADDVDVGRECLLKALYIYLNEDPSNLIRELVEEDESQIQRAMEETTVGIFVVKRHIFDHPDIGIILEGQQVLLELDNVALAAATLFGLIYALNLDYPKELKYTFEVLQKIIMELEGTIMSKKCQALLKRLQL